MSVVDEIFEAVGREAADRNGEVLDRAFRIGEWCCPDCKYPQHASDFESLLCDYMSVKDLLRVYFRPEWDGAVSLKGRVHLVYSPHETIHSRSKWSGDRYTTRLQIEAQKDGLRAKLSEIWPCQNCILKFNPTRRYRRSFKSIEHREPKLSEGILSLAEF